MLSEWIINQHDGLQHNAEVAGNPRDKRTVFNSACNSNKGFFAQLQAARRRASATVVGGRSPVGYQWVRHALSTEVRWDLFLHEKKRLVCWRWHQEEHLLLWAFYCC